MINLNRIKAIIYRYWLNLTHNYDRLTDLFYWPALDLFIWGLVGLYFAKRSSNSIQSVPIILTGLVFWIVIWRAQYEINLNILAEFWDRNLVNLFVSPLKVQEWIISFLIFGFIKTIISVSFSATLSYFLYGYNIFDFGFYLIVFCLSLLMTGWAFGFLIAGFIIRFGTRIQTLAWAGAAVLSPFSAAFYPVDVLPSWAQEIAKVVPSSYIFEQMRSFLFKGEIQANMIVLSFALNIIYLIISTSFFIYMFNKSKQLGMGNLS